MILSNEQFFALVGATLIGGFLLVRKGEKLLDAAGEGAEALSNIVLSPINNTAEGLATITGFKNKDDVTRDQENPSQLFRLRVALFGLPDDFPEEAKQRNPGLFG